jgi:hypothetical protein
MPNAKKKQTAKPKPKPKVVREAVAGYSAKTSRADSKGRVVLGPSQANKTFRVTEQPDGNLLLEPVVVIHEREAWLFKNPEALAMVQKGIKESMAGKTVPLGSYAQYIDLEIDEED